MDKKKEKKEKKSNADKVLLKIFFGDDVSEKEFKKAKKELAKDGIELFRF